METKAKLKKLIDLTGKTFNRFTVIELDKEKTHGDKHWRVFWICKCLCGKVKTVSSQSLRSNHTKSCGCWKKENSQQLCKKLFTKTTVVPPRRNIYTQYLSKCKTKKIDFSISEKCFYDLIESNCYYCGCETKNTKIIKLSPEKIKLYHYNGIDRIDNTKGYVNGNVVPCCNFCNKSKNNLTLTDFYRCVTLLHDNLKRTNQI